MIRVSWSGAVVVLSIGTTAILADWLMNPAEVTPIQSTVSRFPEGWDSAPVLAQDKPLPWHPDKLPMTADDFIAAVTAVERVRPLPRPPQPAGAVFNDAQIASIKDRLELTEAQVPYWQRVEASLREVVWNRSHGDRPRLEPGSLKRFNEAVKPFVETLSAKQRSEIRALANIVGLRLDLSISQ